MTHEQAKEYMVEKFLEGRNADDVYEILSRDMKKAVRNQPIDHYVSISDTHLAGISLQYGTLFTFTDVGGHVFTCTSQEAFTDLARAFAKDGE